MIDRIVMGGLEGPSTAHDLSKKTVNALNKYTMGHANSIWHDLRKGKTWL